VPPSQLSEKQIQGRRHGIPPKKLFHQLFRNLHRLERRAVGQILKIMDAAKVTTVKSVSVFTKETARRVLKLI
jgi:hypothetical protein